MSRVELHTSYIIHTRAYRDTSLLVDVLTQEYGKISLVAKGARKAKNNQRYLLQPFVEVLLSWQGKSSLKTLIGIEAKPNYAGEAGQPSLSVLQGKKLYSAMYANELLAYLLPQDDPCEAIFQYYHLLLQQLSSPEVELESCLRYFEFHLLNEIGYGINFLSNADNDESLQKNKEYFFVQNHGFVEVNAHPEIRDVSFPGKELLCIGKQDFSEQATRQIAKVLSRIALQPHLKGRELKSRALFL